MKKKTETTTKSANPEMSSDYSVVLPLLSASLRQSHDSLTAYVMAPMSGHGLVYAAVYGDANPQVGILDVKIDSQGQLVPGAFGVVVAQGIETYSQILGFFERFASIDVSRDEIVQLFETAE